MHIEQKMTTKKMATTTTSIEMNPSMWISDAMLIFMFALHFEQKTKKIKSENDLNTARDTEATIQTANIYLDKYSVDNLIKMQNLLAATIIA